MATYMYCLICKARLPNAISTHSINKLNRWTRVSTHATDRARRAHGPVCNSLETSQLSLSLAFLVLHSTHSLLLVIVSHTSREILPSFYPHHPRPHARISQKHGWHTHSRAEPKSTHNRKPTNSYSRQRTCPLHRSVRIAFS